MKKEFSECLSDFMRQHAISVSDLSEETQIERTVVYRYVKGKRVPSAVETVVKIADVLQMSEDEKSELYEAYDRAVLGDAVVFGYQYFHNLMWSLENINLEITPQENQWNATVNMQMKQNMLALRSREEIATCVLDVFRSLAGSVQGREDFFLVMQPDYADIQRFISEIFREKEVQIHQLVCLEQSLENGYKNLEIFQKLMQPCFLLPNFDVWYYYDEVGGHINQMSFFPNVLLLGEIVIQFDYEMEHGVVVRNAEYTGVVRYEVEKIFGRSRRLLEEGSTPNNAISMLQTFKASEMISLFCQPCMGVCLDRDILDRCMYAMPQKEELISELLSMRGEWRMDGKEEQLVGVKKVEGFVSYANFSGLEEFMQSGRIREFPSAMYEPLTLAERLRILKRMIVLSQKGIVKYHFISEKVRLPKQVQCNIDLKRRRSIIRRIYGDDILQTTVEEQSLYKSFHTYLKYLQKKDLVCDAESSLSQMMGLWKKYSDSFA